MSIVISGITLDHDMWWTDRYQYVPVTSVAERGLAGSYIVQTYANQGGRPITLSGDSNHGWQRKSTVDSLLALAAVGDATFEIDFNNTTYQCRFRHEDSPAVDFSPVTPVDNPGSDFWYTGTIKLITL